MIIGIINGSSQSDKNCVIENELKNVLKDKSDIYKVVNFGIYPDENFELSYIHTAVSIGILINSGAVNFIITGCSSGTGMMLACNTLPNIICGYIPTPEDAYLFGRINNGNVVSLPLSLNYGWGSEIKLRTIFEQLFIEPFGKGYPVSEAKRKQADTKLLQEIKKYGQKDIIDILEQLDSTFMKIVMSRKKFYEFVLKYGT
ncbi:RpiB/LacA/LacB family sugar-phosphate isomerase, partial [Listeria ilorinensis]|uniref:RpiB/LacA/LacB family sugar-phosphate isomerase n=1 Tax=Listeria ilorinensis TaxID=2867439 RepID=UPI001EF57E1C